jgi:hypothetical protein
MHAMIWLLETRCGAVDFENPGDDQAEKALVIIGVHKSLGAGQPCLIAADGVGVEDGGVEVLLGGEVAEDNGFGDAGGEGDFARSGAAEAAFGEEVDRDFEELAAAVFAGHAGVGWLCRGGNSVGHASIVSKYLLTAQVADRTVRSRTGAKSV